MTAEVFLLIMLSVALLAGSVYFAFRRWKVSQHKKLFTQPLSPSQRDMVQRNVALYRKLPEQFRPELEGNIQIFLHEKRFIGCAGLEITDQMRLTIAANACLLLLTRKNHCFPGFRNLLIYPQSYQVPQTSHHGDIQVKHISHRAGESWYRGPVVLAWEEVLQGSINDQDGFNVVLHEFAHKLDEENALMDGLPILREAENYKDWATTLNREYLAFKTRVKNGKNTVIDAYGATSPVEFFAVITESFFEKPKQMKNKIPKLYQQLSIYYGLDPAQW